MKAIASAVKSAARQLKRGAANLRQEMRPPFVKTRVRTGQGLASGASKSGAECASGRAVGARTEPKALARSREYEYTETSSLVESSLVEPSSDRSKGDFQENPLFQSPVKGGENPLYRQQDLYVRHSKERKAEPLDVAEAVDAIPPVQTATTSFALARPSLASLEKLDKAGGRLDRQAFSEELGEYTGFVWPDARTPVPTIQATPAPLSAHPTALTELFDCLAGIPGEVSDKTETAPEPVSLAYWRSTQHAELPWEKFRATYGPTFASLFTPEKSQAFASKLRSLINDSRNVESHASFRWTFETISSGDTSERVARFELRDFRVGADGLLETIVTRGKVDVKSERYGELNVAVTVSEKRITVRSIQAALDAKEAMPTRPLEADESLEWAFVTEFQDDPDEPSAEELAARDSMLDRVREQLARRAAERGGS